MREWRFGVGYGRDRSWHGQLNAEGIAAPPSPVLFNIATRRRNWVKVECSHEGGGRPRFQRYCGNRAFNRVPAHENSVAGRRAVPETVPRTKEPRARSLRFCARVVSPLPFSILSSPLLFLATVFHLAFSPSLSPLCSRTRPPDTAYISSIVRSPAICPWFLATPDGHACAVYTKHACTIRWMKRVNVSKQSTAKVSRGQSYPRHDRKTALATATRPTRPGPFITSVPVAAVKMIGDTS